MNLPLSLKKKKNGQLGLSLNTRKGSELVHIWYEKHSQALHDGPLPSPSALYNITQSVNSIFSKNYPGY